MRSSASVTPSIIIFRPVIRRIVAADDHDASTGLQFVRCEVEQGRGHQANADDIHPAFTQSAAEGFF